MFKQLFTAAQKALPWNPRATTVEEQQLSSPNRFQLDWQHEYVVGKLPTPGMGDVSYASLGLVEFSPIGPAIMNRKIFQTVFQPTYMPVKSVPDRGVGWAPYVQGGPNFTELTVDNPDLEGYIG